MPNNITIYTDGACGPTNPGPMGIGIYVPKINYASSLFIKDEGTNNIAEYCAVREAVYAIKKRIITNVPMIIFNCDSKLIVEQLNGNWKVKDEKLIPYNREILEQIKFLNETRQMRFAFVQIPREKNAVADALSKRGLKIRQIFMNAKKGNQHELRGQTDSD